MLTTDLQSLSGVLCVCNKEKPDAYFEYNNSVVTLIPMTEECSRYCYNERNEETRNIKEWFYGYVTDGSRIVFYKNNYFKILITSPITLHPIKFYTPLIIKSKNNENVDKIEFNKIIFKNKIINLLYPPDNAEEKIDTPESCSFNIKYNTNLKWKHNIEIANEKFHFIYGVQVLDKWEIGKVYDAINNVNSYIKLEYDRLKSLEDILKYYFYVQKLCQFCSKTLNVGFDISLLCPKTININGQNHNTEIEFIVYIDDGYEDYSHDKLNFYKTIKLFALDNHLSELMKVINEDTTSPYLNFLPKKNKDLNKILYQDIIDICVAVEREFTLLNFEKNEKLIEEAKNLTKFLLKEIKSYECDSKIKQKANNILGAQLKKYSPSLKDKILKLNEHFNKDIQSSDSFSSKVSDFVQMRNNMSHSGIKFNDGIQIYDKIENLIYYSILHRAGFSIKESKAILPNL